ncbi:TonB family protein, partial [Camelimonas abortus]
MASWRSALMAHLNRYKRFPEGGGSGGQAAVAFTINARAALAAGRLVRSSGNSALDSDAVALVRRASPLPP